MLVSQVVLSVRQASAGKSVLESIHVYWLLITHSKRNFRQDSKDVSIFSCQEKGRMVFYL